MKILELQLLAYGPFTDQVLDFSAGHEGLHIVFGPNEAGKSCALRALRAWLYGIPDRTEDTFRHRGEDLLIGGRLRGTDGREWTSLRRKKRKNALLDAQGVPLSTEFWQQLLEGVDEPAFERVFGIDHAELVRGGQELLIERGREAESLFGAGLGNVTLYTVRKRLEQDTSALFLPRALKPVINATLTKLRDLQEQQRAAQLAPNVWATQQQQLLEIKKSLTVLESELASANHHRQKLERIRRTLPNLAKQTQLRRRLAELGEIPVLSLDFATRRTHAMTQRAAQETAYKIAQAQVINLKEQLAVLPEINELLNAAVEIDDLRERRGHYRQILLKHPVIESECVTLEAEARALLARIRPDEVLEKINQQHQPTPQQRRRVTELGGIREARFAAVREAEIRLNEIRERLTQKQQASAALPALPPLDGLRRIIEETRNLGDLDGEILRLRTQWQAHDTTSQTELAALGFWQADLAALNRASLPDEQTLDRFEQTEQRLIARQRELALTRKEILAERHRSQEALHAFQLKGAVPSEDALTQARIQRDRGWELIKKQLVNNEDVTAEAKIYNPEQSLLVAYEVAVLAADGIADRLRREAEQIHEQSSLQAKLHSCNQKLAALLTDIRELNHIYSIWEKDWQAIWTPWQIIPLPPREMRSWLIKALRLRHQASEGESLKTRLQTAEKIRKLQSDALLFVLQSCGITISDFPADYQLKLLIQQAIMKLKNFEEIEHHAAVLNQRIVEDTEQERRSIREVNLRKTECDAWLRDWSALMQQLNLPHDANPTEIIDDFNTLDEVMRRVRALMERRSYLQQSATEILKFQQDASAVITCLAPDLQGIPLEEGIAQLKSRLEQQRTVNNRRGELLTQLNRTLEDSKHAQALLSTAERILQDLCEEAGGVQLEQLAIIEQRAFEQRELTQQLHDLESELINTGDGLSLTELVTEAAESDAQKILAELTALEVRITNDLHPRQRTLFEQQVTVERAGSTMTGADTAASLAEEIQQDQAFLRTQVEKYLRLRLANYLLDTAISQFREQRRDPLIQSASKYFKSLTNQAFIELDTDCDVQEQPLLVGVRANGERLGVAGMSTGTRDQLYLALRLATLDQHVQRAVAFPLIVDDILIQFDDIRTQATLATLADFSSSTQVILFTHHQRVVEQARGLDLKNKRIFIHQLGINY